MAAPAGAPNIYIGEAICRPCQGTGRRLDCGRPAYAEVQHFTDGSTAARVTGIAFWQAVIAGAGRRGRPHVDDDAARFAAQQNKHWRATP